MKLELCSCDPVVIRDGDGEFVAMTLGCNEDVATQQDYDYADELARRWNAFEPDGEVAQLRAENERLLAALSALGPVEYEIPYHGIAWQPCSELNMDCKTKRAIRRVLGEGAA